MKRILITLFFIVSYCLSYGAYYVSYSSGNDNNTAAQAQNSATAWKTLDKVLANIVSGAIPANSTIMLKRGDAWILPKDFNPNRALIFDAYGPGIIKPYVTGLINVPSGRWTLKDANLGVWETTDTIINPRSNTLNMVVVNGQPYEMGRTPNGNAVNKGWLNYEAHTSTSVTDNQSPFDASYAGAQIVIRTTHTNIERGTVSTISGTTINFSTTGFNTSLDPANGWGYFLQNSLKCVDKFGEWFYNTSTKKLSLCVGPLNNPNNFVVQYPSLDTMIQPKASNITFRNIQLTGANRYVVFNDWGGLSNIWFRKVDFAYSGGDFICLPGKAYSGVDSCTAIYANSNAYVFSYHDNGIHITNSVISKIGKFAGMLWKDAPARYGHGIFFSGQQFLTDTGLQAKNLTITDIGYAGIFLGGANNRIEYVYVDTACTVQDDGAGIYIGNYTPTGQVPAITKGNVFSNNIVLHSLGASEGTPGNNIDEAHGMYLDDNTNNALVINNTLAYNVNAGIFLHNANRNRIEYNLAFNNTDEQLYIQDDGIGDSIYLDTVRYNRLVPIQINSLGYYFALDNTAKDSKNFNTWGLIDSNVIAMPFTSNVAKLNHFGGILFATYNLASWQSTWHYDVHSNTIPFAVTDMKDITFAYNTSFTDNLSYDFTCNEYISVDNVSYFNSRTLKPMTADVLLYAKQ